MDIGSILLGVVIGIALGRLVGIFKPSFAGALKCVRMKDGELAFLLDLYDTAENVTKEEFVIFRVDNVDM